MKNLDKSYIAVRIKAARKGSDITQVAMAQNLGIARQTYLDLETGKTAAKANILYQIALLTGRPITSFFPVEDSGIDNTQVVIQKEALSLLERAYNMMVNRHEQI